jgi:hypothetical protein
LGDPVSKTKGLGAWLKWQNTFLAGERPWFNFWYYKKKAKTYFEIDDI